MNQSQRWDQSEAVEQAVEEWLAQWSLEQKVDLVSGKLAIADDGTVPELPAGLPLLALADGPAGIRVANPTLADHRATALPAPIALAATWEPELARRYGDVLGAEAAATGHNIFLGPAVDIARAPWGGRTFEAFGEDPLLQSRLAAPEIEAIQAHGVLACVKHCILNNQEFRRSTINVLADERTLHEVYLPPFMAAVRQGGAAAVMGSYNRIGGVYACENRHVLTTVLREELGFRGFVMSDFLATPSTVESAQAGLDWELGPQMWGPKLLEAVQSGALAAAALDEMARRILRPIVGLGLTAGARELHPVPAEEHGTTARQIAEQAIVLLKNAGGVLPLEAGALRSLAVIGPDADTIAAGGGSGQVQPTYTVSVVNGIRQRVGGGVRIEYAPGVDPVGTGALLPGLPAVPAAVLAPSEAEPGERGLYAEYWDNVNMAGEPVMARVEPNAELNFGFYDLHPGLNAASPKLPRKPAGLPRQFSARWSGVLTAPGSGEYRLTLTWLGTARLILDGKTVLGGQADGSAAKSTGEIAEKPVTRLPQGLPSGAEEPTIKVATTSVQLEAGSVHDVVVEYAADAPGFWVFGEAMLRLGWQMPAGVLSPAVAEAAALAGRTDAALVVVRTYETEEMDRPSLQLPNGQAELIRAVAAANPRTVVVLMNAGPVATASWEADVPAIVEAWYAGQEQGSAVAHVLFGDVNPSGRLPLTFPRDEAQTPVSTPQQYPGVGGVVHYSEGLNVGYRGYARLGLAPQYPFGHGLSYTEFAYSDLAIDVKVEGGGDVVNVAFTLANVGSRTGIEVAQVYVSRADDERSVRLAGWARVRLAPGERRQVAVTLDVDGSEHPFSCWDEVRRGWMRAAGEYRIAVGASATDLRLLGSQRIAS